MPSPTLLQVFRDRASVRRYSPRTTASYERWVVEFIRFNGRRHPRELGAPAVRDFLTHLAQSRHVAASTQNQALAALNFLYREVLEEPLLPLEGVAPAKRPHHLPNVLSREDVQQVFAVMEGRAKLMAMLLYGSGLRVMECCRLRIKDIDIERGEIRVRRGKGDRDRVTMLPSHISADISKLRIAAQTGHPFRLNPARHSGGIRPPILVDSGHPFWGNPAKGLAVLRR